MYAWLVVVSLLFIAISVLICMEKKEVKMNCEACKFAEKGVCQRKPIPTATKDGICQFFIKQRVK